MHISGIAEQITKLMDTKIEIHKKDEKRLAINSEVEYLCFNNSGA